VYGFSGQPLISSHQFVLDQSRLLRIDPSHNEQHSREVLFWATEILSPTSFLSSSDLYKMAHCAILHDMVDSKYKDQTPLVEAHLQQWYSEEETSALLRVMHSMSYHKNLNGFPTWLCPGHPYQDIFHLVRQADLLASYNIARMIDYRLAQGITDPQIIRDEIHLLFEERMAKLVERNLFVHTSARSIALHLEQVSRYKLSMLDTYPLSLNHSLDIFRHVHYLSLPHLISRLEELEPQQQQQQKD